MGGRFTSIHLPAHPPSHPSTPPSRLPRFFNPPPYHECRQDRHKSADHTYSLISPGYIEKTAYGRTCADAYFGTGILQSDQGASIFFCCQTGNQGLQGRLPKSAGDAGDNKTHEDKRKVTGDPWDTAEADSHYPTADEDHRSFTDPIRDGPGQRASQQSDDAADKKNQPDPIGGQSIHFSQPGAYKAAK